MNVGFLVCFDWLPLVNNDTDFFYKLLFMSLRVLRGDFSPFVSRFYNCSSVYLGFITVQVDLYKHTHTPTQHACCCLSLPLSMFILSISLSRSVSACQSISVCEGLRNICPPVEIKLKLEGTQVVLIFSSYFLSGVREEQWWSHKSGQKKTREERAVLITTHQQWCNK